MAKGIEFEWDEHNKKHLAAHKVTPAEFEQVMNNDPLDLGCDVMEDEERFRSVGITNKGRLLLVVWIFRNGKVRAVTAFPASAANRRDFLENRR